MGYRSFEPQPYECVNMNLEDRKEFVFQTLQWSASVGGRPTLCTSSVDLSNLGRMVETDQKLKTLDDCKECLLGPEPIDQNWEAKVAAVGNEQS